MQEGVKDQSISTFLSISACSVASRPFKTTGSFPLMANLSNSFAFSKNTGGALPWLPWPGHRLLLFVSAWLIFDHPDTRYHFSCPRGCFSTIRTPDVTFRVRVAAFRFRVAGRPRTKKRPRNNPGLKWLTQTCHLQHQMPAQNQSAYVASFCLPPVSQPNGRSQDKDCQCPFDSLLKDH